MTRALLAVKPELPFESLAIGCSPLYAGGRVVDRAISTNQSEHPQDCQQRKNRNNYNRDDHRGLHNSAGAYIVGRPYKFERSWKADLYRMHISNDYLSAETIVLALIYINGDP